MRYAIYNEVFLKITQTRNYSFSDLSNKRHFSLHNTNALLHMTDGVLSGKTGYTGDAGYCYVCACQNDKKTFIIALLGVAGLIIKIINGMILWNFLIMETATMNTGVSGKSRSFLIFSLKMVF